jgi:transposase
MGNEPAQSSAHQEVQATEVTDTVWRRLERLLPPAKRTGRPYAHDRRVVLEAIVYLMQTDCRWRELPAEFPPWQTVYAQLCRWKAMGIWEKLWQGLPEPCIVR